MSPREVFVVFYFLLLLLLYQNEGFLSIAFRRHHFLYFSTTYCRVIGNTFIFLAFAITSYCGRSSAILIQRFLSLGIFYFSAPYCSLNDNRSNTFNFFLYAVSMSPVFPPLCRSTPSNILSSGWNMVLSHWSCNYAKKPSKGH